MGIFHRCHLKSSRVAPTYCRGYEENSDESQEFVTLLANGKGSAFVWPFLLDHLSSGGRVAANRLTFRLLYLMMVGNRLDNLLQNLLDIVFTGQ